MVTTYTAADVTSIDAVVVYSDSALTTVVETMTAGNFAKLATGQYQTTDEFTYASYTLGQTYFIKITWTPDGGTQRSDSFEMIIAPQGQANDTSGVTTTDCDGAHVQAPQLSLRIGRGGFRESDFENAGQADLDRFIQNFPMPDDAAAGDIHFLISNSRAGAPTSFEFLFAEGTTRDEMRKGAPKEFTVPVPGGPGVEGGYRGSAFSPSHFLRRSTDISLEGDLPRTRAGYRVQRQIALAAASYTERLQLDKSDGSLVAAIRHVTDIYTDAAPPVAFATTWGHSALTDPYAANANLIPQTVHIRGVLYEVNGVDADFRVIHNDGSNKAKPKLADPVVPATALIATGSMTAQETFIRIQFKDNDTLTVSGPSQRTATATSETTAGGNLSIQVTPDSFPGRATHWRVATAATDTPSSYSIHLAALDASAGSDIADANGWIVVAEVDCFLEADPTGDALPFRSVDGVAVYQHANPPTGASHIAHYNGRALYASSTDTYLVISESDNPEHFLNDPDSPHAGFNTFRGETLVDAVLSPCTALAATETQVLFFMRSGLVVYEGSLVLDVASSDSTAQVRGRDARARIVAQDSYGAISPAVQIVDHDAYVFTQRGPGVFTGGRLLPIHPEAVSEDWKCRDPVFEHRGVVGFDPDRGQVLFSFATTTTAITGQNDRTLAYSTNKDQWCPPWNINVCSWTLHRLIDTGSSTSRGTRLLFGGPYGSINEYGYGWGDGEDGSDTDALGLNSTSATTTTATVTGKSWATDVWKSDGVVLEDRTTGRQYYRTLKSNTGTVITWEGAQSDSGGGWKIFFGGIPYAAHIVQTVPGLILMLMRARIQLQDQLSRVA